MVCVQVRDSYCYARMWMMVYLCKYMHVCRCGLYMLTCVNTHACVSEYGLCLCDRVDMCMCVCVSLWCVCICVGGVCVLCVCRACICVVCVWGVAREKGMQT